MSAEFFEVVPGVKGRVVMQIIGRRVAGLNPDGIRYLPLGSAQLGSTVSSTLLTATTALSGINLLLSAGTLSVSAATLASVRKMSAKVDTLLSNQRNANRKLDAILKELNKVSTKVSEGRLATIVDHAVRACAHGHEISFASFKDLATDLEGFSNDVGIVPGRVVDLRLGSDVRGALRRICWILRGVRLELAHGHNRACSDAESVWACDPDADYWADADQLADLLDDMHIVQVVKLHGLSSLAAHQAVNECFTFNPADDHAAIQTAMNETLVDVLMERGVDEDAARSAVSAAHDNFGEFESKDSKVYLDAERFERYAGSLCDALYETLASHGHEARYAHSLLASLDEVEDDAATDELMRDFRSWWLHQTDAGLIYRTQLECAGLRDGYVEVFGAPAMLDVIGSGDDHVLTAPIVVEFEPLLASGEPAKRL
jgi:hypothetical protein